jgi:hypothetical protein
MVQPLIFVVAAMNRTAQYTEPAVVVCMKLKAQTHWQREMNTRGSTGKFPDCSVNEDERGGQGHIRKPLHQSAT